MKILKSWLKEYADFDLSDGKLDDLLTYSGTLVEEVTGGIDDKIIVAKILEINPHPNAGRLHLIKVDTGSGEIEVVCGAPNIEVGQIGAFAQVGSRVLDFEVSEAEIRGVKSPGMMLSERELGLSSDHRGIYVFEKDVELGRPVAKYLNTDTVFDLEITPNRGDCLSHLGVAREVAAQIDQKLKFAEGEFGNFEKPAGGLRVEIQNPDHCFKYCGAVIRGVKIAESPEWLKQKLIAVGTKPINNVVDITNFVMLDLGQPLHAFDKPKISGERIIVRNASDGEKITTIDGVERKLDNEMLVIADEQKAVAIAGVMGGENSAIDDNTTEIVLESAVFERKSVRRTAKILKLTTDASYRFERGIDAELAKTALLKAAKMICEIAGGEVLETIIDTAQEEKNDFVKIEHKKINELLGTALSNEQIDKYLVALGFKLKDEMCLPPSWRHDVMIWQDLAEEVSRLYGFAQIPMVKMQKEDPPKTADYYFKEALKDILVAQGFAEVFTYPFLSEADIKTIGLNPEDLLEVANPVQSENKFMRNSLVPGLMRVVAKNPTFDPILVFEFGNIFGSFEKNIDKEEPTVSDYPEKKIEEVERSTESEKTKIAVASSGKGAKAVLESCVKTLADKTGLDGNVFEIKEFSRDELAKYKIKKPNVFVFELDAGLIVEAMKKSGTEADFVSSEDPVSYREVSKFPPVNRDLAFIVDEKLSLSEIRDLILETSKYAVLVEAFDEFSSDKFGSGKKSVAFHIWLEDLNKTLSVKEADQEISKIVESLKDKFSATLRS